MKAGAGRSLVERAAAWSFLIAGVLTLARVLLELVKGLAELPGASEHWSGDVVLWLIFVLPLPILAGATMLGAARWLSSNRIGVRAAAALYLGSIAVAATWILLRVAAALGEGNEVRLLEDPLLWAPIAMMVGAAAGLAVMLWLSVQERRDRPG